MNVTGSPGSEGSTRKQQKVNAFKAQIDKIVSQYNALTAVMKELYLTEPGEYLEFLGPGNRPAHVDRKSINSYIPALRDEISHLKTEFTEASRVTKHSKLTVAELLIAVQAHTNYVRQALVAHLGNNAIGQYHQGLYGRYAQKDDEKLIRDHKDPSSQKPLSYISDQLTNFFKASNFGNGLIHLFPNAWMNNDPNVSAMSNGASQALVNAYGGQDQVVNVLRAQAQMLGVTLPGSTADIIGLLQQFEDAKNYFVDLINASVGSTTIVFSLFFVVIHANNLQSSVDKTRYRYNQEMIAAFTQPTQFSVNGRPISTTIPAGTKSKKAEELQVRLNRMKQSGIDVIRSHEPIKARATKKGPPKAASPAFIDQSQARSSDNYGFHQTMIITLVSQYVIPNEFANPLTDLQGQGQDVNVMRARAVSSQAIAKLINQRHSELKDGGDDVKKYSRIDPEGILRTRRTRA